MFQVMLEDAGSQLAQAVQKQEPISHCGNAKDTLNHMADDFDAPLEDFEDYMPEANDK